MKLIFSLAVVLLALTIVQKADAQLIEMAANCDKAIKTLSELIKPEHGHSVEKIKERLGVDVLIECDTPDGKATCFQCLDDNQELKLIQIIKKTSDGLFESPVFGCRCKSPR